MKVFPPLTDELCANISGILIKLRQKGNEKTERKTKLENFFNKILDFYFKRCNIFMSVYFRV